MKNGVRVKCQSKLEGAPNKRSYSHLLWHFTLTPLLLISCSQANEPLTFASAEVRGLLPGRTTTAAYVTITNNTQTAIVLRDATSEQVRKIEFHTHIHNNNQVKMRQLANLLIPANDSIVLTTGGTHLMLFGVTELNKGIGIQFTSQSGDKFAAEFELQGTP